MMFGFVFTTFRSGLLLFAVASWASFPEGRFDMMRSGKQLLCQYKGNCQLTISPISPQHIALDNSRPPFLPPIL